MLRTQDGESTADIVQCNRSVGEIDADRGAFLGRRRCNLISGSEPIKKGLQNRIRRHGNIQIDCGQTLVVAAEAVVLAETKDHQNWHLIGEVSKKVKGDVAKVLKEAHEEVEHEEDEHLYHTKGWSRELWIESLGMKAVLPPPEEVKKVETAIGAARAEKARTQMAK